MKTDGSISGSVGSRPWVPDRTSTQADCLWSDPLPPAAPTVKLEDGETADLAVIGGGILGLSTALHAARAGLSVRVLDAGEIGQRAAGLNGGQVIPGLKHDPDELIAMFGERRGERIIAFSAGAADAVFDLIDAERLAVPHHRAGWIQAAHTPAAAADAAERTAAWQVRGADVAALDPPAVAALTGAAGYHGGWIDRRAGAIQPLRYTLELARIAAAAGARIAALSPVDRLREARGRWSAETADGKRVEAKTVVVATNAYSGGLVPGLAETLIKLHSFQVATEKLDPERHAAILPGGQPVSDSRRIVCYYRRSPDGRFIMGGRGTMAVPTRPADWAHLEHAAVRLYPALKGLRFTHRWFGRVCMTLDHLPHIHEPAPGLLAVAGCQGRGIGLMTALGRALAETAASGDREALPLPITPIRPIPLHRFHRIGVGLTVAWYRVLDRLDA